MRRRGLLLVLAFGLGVGCAAAHPASAAENGDFSLRPDRPASAEARDRSYIVKTVAPGTELADRLLAVNLGDKPIELDIAPVDATVTADGAFAPGTAAAAEGSWMTVTPARVRVPAGGTTRVDVRIRVPATATPGDHIAAVVAQRADAGTQQMGNVRLVQRVGVRVYLTVEPSESSRVGTLDRSFELRGVRWAGDAFEVEVANTGDLLVEPLGTVSVSRGGLGASADFPVLGTVLPGQVGTFRVRPPGDLEPGTYDGKVRMRLVQGGPEQEKGLTFTLDGPLKAADSPSPSSGRQRTLPWLLVVVALLALGGVAVEARRRLAA